MTSIRPSTAQAELDQAWALQSSYGIAAQVIHALGLNAVITTSRAHDWPTIDHPEALVLLSVETDPVITPGQPPATSILSRRDATLLRDHLTRLLNEDPA